MTVVSRFVQAASYGGALKKPTLIVVHSAETPLKAGYAYSIAKNWFAGAATTSAHFMVDPVEAIQMVPTATVAYHCGPAGNGFTIGIEQSGYASLTRAQWTTADGLAQLKLMGALIAELATQYGIPLRWATDAQIKAAASGTVGGLCFHDDIHRVLGGTTHTDPKPNYPDDLLLAAALEAANPTAPAEDEDDDMPQAISHTVPAGERRHIAFPPALAGAAGWGAAWLTIRTDCFTDPAAAVKVRLALQGSDGKYRVVPGQKAYDTTVSPGLGLNGIALTKGDCGLVVTATTQPVSVLVEYAKA